jgi:hypothetical protein
MSEAVATEKNAIAMDSDSRAHLDSMHRLGRIGVVCSIIVMLGIPAAAGIYFNAMPTILQILTTAVSLLALFIPVTISETIAYSPILGSSYYLANITGNIFNLKIPVAKAALRALDVEDGTEDADIVTSIAVGVSSFVTLAVIVIGVILIQPLRPVLSSPVFRQASGSILQALFGSLFVGRISNQLGGGIRAKGHWKGMIMLFAIVTVAYIIVIYVIKKPMWWSLYQGFLMMALIPIAWFGHKWMYKTGRIKVLLPGEK